jgi:uncharacterized membrane protein
LKEMRTEGLITLVLLLPILVFPALVFPVLAQPEGTGNVHGTVVDEDDAALYRVKLLIYSTTGDITVKYTDVEGYFRFALLAGKYTIYFEKDGYVTVKKEITVPAGWQYDPGEDPVKMGEIILKKALRLTTSVLSRVVTAGDIVTFPFTVSNIGDKPEEIQFLVVAPEGWGTRILSATGEVKKVLLESGSMSLDLEVNLPSTFDEFATVSLTAIGTKNATLDFTVYPKTSITQEIKLKSTYLSVSEEIGRSIYFPLTITNNGEVDEIVDLMGFVPSGWSISFITGSNMVVQSLYLASSQSESLTIKVVPSKDAIVGDYFVVVNAVSEDQILRDSLELRVNLREATSDVEIISTFTDVTVEAGSNINFRITIWNKGETDALFLLTLLSVPQNWKTVFTSDDIEISSALVTAGESLTLQLEVTPPKTVEMDEYPIIVYAESDDGLITKQIDLKVNVVGSYEMDLELSTLYKTLTIGDSVEFTAKVTNQGNSPITTIYLDTIVPEDWETTITPAQVPTLAPRESVTFTIVADTPADTVAGDYLITVQTLSDQVESGEVDLRVTAKASTSWGFIGIGLAGIAVIGIIIAFTRFKRR